jgi:hypothetical protein
MEMNMTEEKIVPPVVASAAQTLQADPAMLDATFAVGAILSQAPALTATDVKPVVDKPASVVAPTIVAQK